MPIVRRFAPMRCIAAALVSLACASGSAPAGTAPAATGRAASEVITRDELADPALAGSTALDAAHRLRPSFFTRRGGGTGGGPGDLQVSINGVDLQPVSELARVAVGDVSEIRYLSTSDAAQRFGTRTAMGPVLLVTLRRR